MSYRDSFNIFNPLANIFKYSRLYVRSVAVLTSMLSALVISHHAIAATTGEKSNQPLPTMKAAVEHTTPSGLWRTIDDKTKQPKAIISISIENGVLSGKLVKSLVPGTNPDRLCEACKGELHNHPMRNLPIISDLKLDGNEWQGGTILDPESGKVYKAKVKLTENNQVLEVHGYIGIPAFGRTQRWQRVND